MSGLARWLGNGPALVYIGIKGLLHADLHRWLWGSMSLVAGAVLTSVPRVATALQLTIARA